MRLHARDVRAIDLRHAPHFLAPRLEFILGQAPAHGLAGDALMIGEANHLAGEQFDGPAGAALGRTGACGRNQQRLLLAGELALGAGTGLLVDGLLEIALHESGAWSGRRSSRPRRVSGPWSRPAARVLSGYDLSGEDGS